MSSTFSPRVWTMTVLGVASGIVLGVTEAPGQSSPSGSRVRPVSAASPNELPRGRVDLATPAASPADGAVQRTAEVPAEEGIAGASVGSRSTTRAVARFEGTAAPGLRITLDASGSTGEDLRYFWVQTKGKPVALPQPDAPRLALAIPGDCADLAFALVVTGRSGTARADLAVPLVLHDLPTLPDAEVMADAGDDQTAIVGHQVTLNGVRSRPRDGLAFRWVQTDGPEITAKVESKWVCTFIPTAPGLYRFFLVVAADGAISEPDEVRILVAASAPAALKAPAPALGEPVQATTREGLLKLGASGAAAGALAEVFEGIADRTSLYTDYGELFSELSRRLASTLPADSKQREDWGRVVLDPLSLRIVKAMRAEGLDLTRSSQDATPLTPKQKARLGDLFDAAARGCREAVEAAPR